MSEKTAISWTHHTFNPWWGCTKVSEACRFCYAERDANRFAPGLWGADAPRKPASEATWREPLRWDRAAEKAGVRRRVFCASMADVFEDRRDLDAARARLWALIETTPNLDWLLLTKRPGRVNALSPLRWLTARPSNAWVGTTVEDQAAADARIPELLEVHAAVRFLSCEPLLGPVNLGSCLDVEAGCPLDCAACDHKIDWVIAGGESGAAARPMHPAWIRALRDQCSEAGVPFHFKQWGEFSASIPPAGLKTSDPLVTDGAGGWTAMRRVGKKAAGRLLDGLEHNGFPVSP